MNNGVTVVQSDIPSKYCLHIILGNDKGVKVAHKYPGIDGVCVCVVCDVADLTGAPGEDLLIDRKYRHDLQRHYTSSEDWLKYSLLHNTLKMD